MVKVRTATQEDFKALEGKALPRTVRAIAITYNGELAAVAGHYLQDGCVVLFSKIAPAAREVKGFGRYVLRFARDALREVRDYGMPVLAQADPSVPRSAELLEHLGFKAFYKETYIWVQQCHS